MLIKTDKDQVEAYLTDASFMRNGHADRLVFPETAEEVADVLLAATKDRTPITISGAGTGTVGGRVAFGGVVLATDRLNKIKSITHHNTPGGRAVVEAGVVLSDFQNAVEAKGLLYPPDPTERSCFVGGTVATNASGARTFKYGPTRRYINRAKIALASGDLIDLRRGQLRADNNGHVEISLGTGRRIKANLPTYQMPHTRKNATGYFVKPDMDVLDLFIGSEGTLGVVVEVETELLAKPEALLSGVVFFKTEKDVLSFVADARQESLESRARGKGLDARALEYFDRESLGFLRQKYSAIPQEATEAVFFEQETSAKTEDKLLSAWMTLLERHNSLADSWFATSEQDQAQLREFRHQLPVLMNEWFARYGQKKVSTDMAVPDDAFPGMLKLYKETLRESHLRYTVFGHIGDNHIHVNILPRDDSEATHARDLYVRFLKYAASVGGTLSAEHGVGKLKRDYLRIFFSDEQLREMAALKLAFDPAGILGRGNIFSEEMLADL